MTISSGEQARFSCCAGTAKAVTVNSKIAIEYILTFFGLMGSFKSVPVEVLFEKHPLIYHKLQLSGHRLTDSPS